MWSDPQTVSQSLQALVTGYTVTTVRDRTEKVAVVARATANQRSDLGAIGDLTILAHNGVPVPLSQVAHIELGHEDAILWRRNRDLAITVRSDFRAGSQASDVSQRVWFQLEHLRSSLPVGYRIETGGSVELVTDPGEAVRGADGLRQFDRAQGIGRPTCTGPPRSAGR